jgi:hypothetical protein
VRVVLLSKGGEELEDPPGRDLLLSETDTFAELAAAIDRAFARWDLSHLHEFRLMDGRRVIMMEGADEFEEIDPSRHLDELRHSLGSVGLRAGETFMYVFDFGDNWEHGCTVLRTDVDPVAESGVLPTEIVPVFGWGTIPDQYGRLSLDEEP